MWKEIMRNIRKVKGMIIIDCLITYANNYAEEIKISSIKLLSLSFFLFLFLPIIVMNDLIYCLKREMRTTND